MYTKEKQEESIVTINIDNETDNSWDFDIDKVIEDAIKKTMDFMKFPYEAQVNVLVTTDEEIHKINLEYRNIDRPTDVLSFPMVEYEEPGDFDVIEKGHDSDLFDPDSGELVLGDIVLSVDKIMEQAVEYGHSQIREISFLVVHSMLHLFGYDHMDETDKTMENLQRDILEWMGISR